MRLRLPLVLAFLALGAPAQDLPLIGASGTSLETFDVDLRLDAVDHASAEGLARSFARFVEEQHGVNRRFGELVAEAHIDLMRAYYARDLVDRQARAYAAPVQKGYACEVKSVGPGGDTTTAMLESRYVEGGKQRTESSELVLRRDAKGWWIEAIRDKGPDGTFSPRALGVPPAMKSIPVPPAAAPDPSSAKALLSSLREAVLRFAALRDNASMKLNGRFFDITAAFYGEDVARKAREERPRPEPLTPAFVEFGAPTPRLADLVRIEVTVREQVPGREDLRSAIGQAAFDLRPEEGGWRVVGEFYRRKPDQALTPVTSGFGSFFFVRR
jgi:hypothetical protein